MSRGGTSDNSKSLAVGGSVDAGPSSEWSRAKLIAFRFSFALAALSTFILIGVPQLFVSSKLMRSPIEVVFARWDWLQFPVTVSIGAFVIRTLTGSKSTVHDIVWNYSWSSPVRVLSDVLGLLIVALLITVIWTFLDRSRVNYCTLNRPMRIYLRYALGVAMLTYATAKVIPTQFGFLTPGELLKPFGQLSGFSLLWDFMAASPGYTAFTGLVELAGATLLFFRRTTLLGSLVLAGALVNVIAMDIGYGIGPVHFAIVLLILDLLVLAPYLLPLSEVMLQRSGHGLPPEPVPLRQRWYHSPVAKFVLLCVFIIPRAHQGLMARRSYFKAGHPVYGLFDVTNFARNGKPITPLASDSTIWKRVASDGRYGKGAFLTVEFANGHLRQFRVADDAFHHTWAISQWGQNSTPMATLRYTVLHDRDVSLDGKLGNDLVHMRLHPVDMKKYFPLLRR
jgi:hypothetical protein